MTVGGCLSLLSTESEQTTATLMRQIGALTVNVLINHKHICFFPLNFKMNVAYLAIDIQDYRQILQTFFRGYPKLPFY